MKKIYLFLIAFVISIYILNSCKPKPIEPAGPISKETFTVTPTSTLMVDFSQTPTNTYTVTTDVSATSTSTPKDTYTFTSTHTATERDTETPTSTATERNTETPTYTETERDTITPTYTETFTTVNTLTPTITPTVTSTCQIYYKDLDGDGYGVSNEYMCLTSPSGPYNAILSGDCDDSNAQIYPGNTEKCNGFDDNCDGLVDGENSQGCLTYFRDYDLDGYGILNDSKCLCSPYGHYLASQAGDCNDSNAQIYPGNTEKCNGIDDNCDGLVDNNCTP